MVEGHDSINCTRPEGAEEHIDINIHLTRETCGCYCLGSNCSFPGAEEKQFGSSSHERNDMYFRVHFKV